MNAKEELLDHIGSREVVYVRVSYRATYEKSAIVEGTLSEVLPGLDFEYDPGYGSQYIDEGTIWYADGTWSAREEYDGSEWWAHRERPVCPKEVSNLRAEDVTQELERVKGVCRDQETNLEAALAEIARLDSLVTELRAEIEDLREQLYRANNGGLYY